MLRIKSEGWELFCGRLGVPPYLVCEGLPGFERFQRTLA